jgi:hypothetical protein
MIRQIFRLALGSALTASTAFAMDTGTPSQPWAGANCIKYTIGANTYAFNTSDLSNNADGRKTAVNDAFLQGYKVTVSVAHEVGFSATQDKITCNTVPTTTPPPSPEMFLTPWQVIPVSP